MSIHTLGTNANNSLNAIEWWPALTTTSSSAAKTLSLADAETMAAAILSADLIGTTPQGIELTGSIHSSATLDTLSAVGGPPLAGIKVGALVMGVGIPLGTYVQSRTPATGTPTSITLSQNASATAAGVSILIVNPGMTTYGNAANAGFDPASGRIVLPDNRGFIKLRAGDYIAVDNTGAVIVVPYNAVQYPGSLWTFT